MDARVEDCGSLTWMSSHPLPANLISFHQISNFSLKVLFAKQAPSAFSSTIWSFFSACSSCTTLNTRKRVGWIDGGKWWQPWTVSRTHWNGKRSMIFCEHNTWSEIAFDHHTLCWTNLIAWNACIVCSTSTAKFPGPMYHGVKRYVNVVLSCLWKYHDIPVTVCRTTHAISLDHIFSLVSFLWLVELVVDLAIRLTIENQPTSHVEELAWRDNL